MTGSLVSPASASSSSFLTMSSLTSPLSRSPTLSPNDFPNAPPPTPNPVSSYSSYSAAHSSPSVSPPVSAAIAYASSPTRSRTISAPIATAPSQALSQPLSTISVQVSRLAAQLESEEEEKEESPLFSSSAAGNFPSFSARLTAAKRRSPIPRLEIKIESNGEEQGGRAQANGVTAQGKPVEESKEASVQPAAGGRMSASQYAKTPQNSPAAPMTPLAFDTSSAFAGGFVPITPSVASRPRYTKLHSYQPITPVGSPAAPTTPGPASSPTFASSPIPVTPTPSQQREYDPPPTPNSASFSRTAPSAFASPLPVAALPPPQRLLTRSVSQGPAPSAQPQRRAYMQDAIPNTPFEIEPATPTCTPALGKDGAEDFTVGLQSIPPSPSPFQPSRGAGERKGWKEPAGVPNTPMSPGGAGWSMPPPSAFAAMSWPPASPGTLAAIDEVDTPLDRTPTPAPPVQAAAAAAAVSSSYSASALVALSDPVLTPSIAYFLTLIRSLRQSGRISEEQRSHLKEQLMSTSPFFLAAFALIMQAGVTAQTEDELGSVLISLLSPPPSPAAALAPVQYQYRFSSLLPITMAEHRALSTAVQRLALHRLPLSELWSAFEAESAFDELTEPAFLSSLHSLLTSAPSSSSSSLSLKQAVAAHLSLYSALRGPRGERSQYVSFPEYLSSLLCFTSASVTEKTTTVFQLLDADGNNSVAAAQCQRWCEQVCRLLQQLIALTADSADCSSFTAETGLLLFRQADVMLKGKLSIRKFLAWSNNPVAVVAQMLHTLY